MEIIEKYLGFILDIESKVETIDIVRWNIKDYPSILSRTARIIYKKRHNVIDVEIFNILSCSEDDSEDMVKKFQVINEKFEYFYNKLIDNKNKTIEWKTLNIPDNDISAKLTIVNLGVDYAISILGDVELETVKKEIDKINILYDKFCQYLYKNKEIPQLCNIEKISDFVSDFSRNTFRNKCNYYIFMISETEKNEKLQIVSSFFEYVSENVNVLLLMPKLYEIVINKVEQFYTVLVENNDNSYPEVHIRKVILNFLYFFHILKFYKKL